MKIVEKIGIVTLHGYKKYGNKLQNYALKFILEKLGFKVSTTIIRDSKKRNGRKILSIISNLSSKQLYNKMSNVLFPSKRKEKNITIKYMLLECKNLKLFLRYIYQKRLFI